MLGRRPRGAGYSSRPRVSVGLDPVVVFDTEHGVFNIDIGPADYGVDTPLGTGRTRNSLLRPYGGLTRTHVGGAGGDWNWFPSTDRLNYALIGTPSVPGDSHFNYSTAALP